MHDDQSEYPSRTAGGGRAERAASGGQAERTAGGGRAERTAGGGQAERPSIRQRPPHAARVADADASSMRQTGTSSAYLNHDRYRAPAKAPQRAGKRRRTSLLVGLGIMAVIALGVLLFVQSIPTSITFNGSPLDVRGSRTLKEAVHVSGTTPRPGDLVAVDGSVLEAGKGEPFHATVNGEAVSDLSRKLASGDIVDLGDGKAVEEPSDVAEEAIPWVPTVEGNGAIHLIEGSGQDGMKAIKTGKASGKTAQQVVREPVNARQRNVAPDVGDDKVIALTFDDGPWSNQTGAVLDILAQNGAKATFFTVGNRIEQNNGAQYVQRAASEGHQICTHTYDHAAGSGQSVNLGYMSHEERVAEIEKGYAAIEAVTGTQASRIVRTPGGNFGPEVVRSIGPLIKAEIGWNIDSGDWRRPGSGAIVNQLKNTWPGAIVLMHDGGGDRSQTIEALKIALPYLKDQGYRFVTMDELMQYPLV